MKYPLYLAEMSWTEVEEAKKEVDIVVLPLGTTEQHGPQLPLRVDYAESIPMLEKAAAEVGGVLIAPIVPYGFSKQHARHGVLFPGTCTLEIDVLGYVIRDVVRSLTQHFSKVLVWNMHMGNRPALLQALPPLRKELEGKAIVDATAWPFLPHMLKVLDEVLECDWFEFEGNQVREDRHAGEVETSLMLFAFPEEVRLEKIVKGGLCPRAEWGLGNLDEGTGVIGDPTLATREKGEKMAEAIVKDTIELLKRLRKADVGSEFQPTWL